MRAGLLHIYHGGGKGKTTAAAGLCLRAAGHGLRVGFAQFLKDGSSGECAALKVLPGVTVFDALPHVPFTFSMTPEDREEARDFYASLLRACESAASGLDLLVLDEVLDAVNTGILPEESLLAFVKNRPDSLELVLPGRDPSPELLELADYITEMRVVRHPYQRGQAARPGIEW